jgi:CO/xanthine dehydrogenase FAD-binding subunit
VTFALPASELAAARRTPDPTAEQCLLPALLDLSVVIEGSGDRRSVPATESFRGVTTTAPDHDEVVVEVVFPGLLRAALTEFAERRGTSRPLSLR